MAKVTPKKLDPKDGKWVTINGNHIFIKTGQTVQQALNETVSHHKAEYEEKTRARQEEKHEAAKRELGKLMSAARNGETRGTTEKQRQKAGKEAQKKYYESLSPKNHKEELQRDVWNTMTSYWHSGHGIDGRNGKTFAKKLVEKGYTRKEIWDEFDRQIDEYFATWVSWSLDDD